MTLSTHCISWPQDWFGYWGISCFLFDLTALFVFRFLVEIQILSIVLFIVLVQHFIFLADFWCLNLMKVFLIELERVDIWWIRLKFWYLWSTVSVLYLLIELCASLDAGRIVLGYHNSFDFWACWQLWSDNRRSIHKWRFDKVLNFPLIDVSPRFVLFRDPRRNRLVIQSLFGRFVCLGWRLWVGLVILKYVEGEIDGCHGNPFWLFGLQRQSYSLQMFILYLCYIFVFLANLFIALISHFLIFLAFVARLNIGLMCFKMMDFMVKKSLVINSHP